MKKCYEILEYDYIQIKYSTINQHKEEIFDFLKKIKNNLLDVLSEKSTKLKIIDLDGIEVGVLENDYLIVLKDDTSETGMSCVVYSEEDFYKYFKTEI